MEEEQQSAQGFVMPLPQNTTRPVPPLLALASRFYYLFGIKMCFQLGQRYKANRQASQ